MLVGKVDIDYFRYPYISHASVNSRFALQLFTILPVESNRSEVPSASLELNNMVFTYLYNDTIAPSGFSISPS